LSFLIAEGVEHDVGIVSGSYPAVQTESHAEDRRNPFESAQEDRVERLLVHRLQRLGAQRAACAHDGFEIRKPLRYFITLALHGDPGLSVQHSPQKNVRQREVHDRYHNRHKEGRSPSGKQHDPSSDASGKFHFSFTPRFRKRPWWKSFE